MTLQKVNANCRIEDDDFAKGYSTLVHVTIELCSLQKLGVHDVFVLMTFDPVKPKFPS